jgi:hypothetical protein
MPRSRPAGKIYNRTKEGKKKDEGKEDDLPRASSTRDSTNKRATSGDFLMHAYPKKSLQESLV